ncbi:uncharacterized protein LOC128088392 isoform X2 [Tympanuchus pallidicinctus]|uniref:uncharacterized protein LOC128088392 isoform X2 n=1 Tax=Tympanuchus pallidicinctus TaxID=109042 RepID=UPI002286FD15|nr:uncharacterized protein LOC128088392 isoform X2 [Tympanuchus pallidicinctus]
MEERRKKRSPRGQLAPARASRLLPTSRSASFALPLPALPSQRARPRRASKERVRAGAARGAPLQHSFLTEVSDVCEMEGGLLGLLSDFHSGKLQAFGKECSFEQLEHVREMQEKLARLHFGLDVCVEELPEEQKKLVADRNLDQLLAHGRGVAVVLVVVVVVVQGTCRPAVLSLDSNAVRSCTWPRAPALRRPRPDNRRLRGGGPAGWGGRDGGAPLAHPAGPTAVTRGSPSSPHPPQPPFWSAARSGAVTSSDGAVTSSDGALVAPEAMAAAPGPREQSAERRRLLRAVTRLQAGVRGFLLRRRLRGVRAEYEEVVREIEGELSELRWTGLCLPRPVFVSELSSARSSNCTRNCALRVPSSRRSAPLPRWLSAARSAASRPERKAWGKVCGGSNLNVRCCGRAAGNADLWPVKEKCSPLREAVWSDKDSTEKTQQELDVPKPEWDWGSSNSVKRTARLQSEKELSSVGECRVASPANLGAVTSKSTEKSCSAPSESKEWQNSSSISSVWDSTDLEPGSLKACLEIPLVDVKELPRTRPGLQSFRNHLIMELLWLQQAINSRKNYLKLKQRLESPDS